MKKDGKDDKSKTQTDDLRKQAEKIAGKTDSPENIEMMSPEERRMLLHELRVHQVELEMQNEELQRTEAELSGQRERYFDLYDLAPVGYMTVSKQGLIIEANQTVATLLGVAKSALSKTLLTRFIIKEDQDIYYRYRKELFETGKPQTFELRMVKKDETYFWAHLDAITALDHSASSGQAEGALVSRIMLSDITERMQAAELLRESQEQLRSAHRLAHIGIWNWIAETDTVTWSEELYHIAGIDPAKSAPTFSEQSNIYAPESWALLKIAAERALETAAPYQLELKLIRPDGTARWVNAFGGATYDNNGRNIGLHGTLQDITERKQAEEALVFLLQCGLPTTGEDFFESLARYLAQTLGMDYVCIDRLEGDGLTAQTVAVYNDGILECNVSYALKDTPCGEVVGKGVCCYPRGVRQLFPRDEALQELKAESYFGTTLVDSKGRQIGLIAVIGHNVLDDPKSAESLLKLVAPRAAGEMERRRTEEELAKRESLLNKIFDVLPIGLWFADENGRLLRGNPTGVKIWGAEPTVPMEKYGVFKARRLPSGEEIAPDDWALAHTIKEGVTIQDELLEIDAFDGQKRVVINYTAPVLDDKGNLLGAIVVNNDITAQKYAEEEKRILEERLSRAEKMESLGLLAGGVAHDLNNVLGIVVGYAELLLDSVDEKSPLRKDLATIFDGGQKAAAIVEDLLTLARRGVVGKQVLNLNKLIGNFKKSPQWEKLLTYHPNVQIKTELDADLLNISASSIHLEKTLYNLVSNAGEAMTKGGNITIKTSNKYIDKPIHGYDTIHEGDYVVLSVSDEGDGISETDIKRIFEPFYTKKIMGRSGTGLGLSVVWGTVKDHQGYIDVQSKEGTGTTFTLYFMITREDIPEEGLAVSMSEYLGNGESILIVDDVKDQRDLAARLLTSINYKVSSVSSGEDAIKYLKEHKADLLVLDMIMDPGMDGLDTYKSILEINPKQKAIIVSGFSESDRVKEAKALGAGAYIKKPYIKEKLGLAVKKELGRL